MAEPLMLHPRVSGGGSVVQIDSEAWRLEIPSGNKDSYRLAQLDDYTRLRRSAFLWQPDFHLRLQARASAIEIPGTWGFGVWNDPFSASLGLGGADRRLPALPEAAWFFYASPANYLSFRDDLPAQGFLAATFRSVQVPPALMMLGSPLLISLLFPGINRLARLVARKLVHQVAALITIDPTGWHTYDLVWTEEIVQMRVDGNAFLDTHIAPRNPLGLVFWVDNQYAAWTPNGQVRLGSLANQEPAWIEIKISTPA
jgi:hypothetical protein